jgi:steroid delta-isomerase-like uncharacterized protein
MTAEKNKELARRSFEEVWSQGNMAAADMLNAANIVFHDPAAPGIEGLAAYKQLITMYRSTFNNLHFTVLDQVAEGDKVVTRWRATSTHTGAFMGIPPTHREAAVTGISIDRFVGGKVVETWSNWDALGLLQQLGAIPVAQPA